MGLGGIGGGLVPLGASAGATVAAGGEAAGSELAGFAALLAAVAGAGAGEDPAAEAAPVGSGPASVGADGSGSGGPEARLAVGAGLAGREGVRVRPGPDGGSVGDDGGEVAGEEGDDQAQASGAGGAPLLAENGLALASRAPLLPAVVGSAGAGFGDGPARPGAGMVAEAAAAVVTRAVLFESGRGGAGLAGVAELAPGFAPAVLAMPGGVMPTTVTTPVMPVAAGAAADGGLRTGIGMAAAATGAGDAGRGAGLVVLPSPLLLAETWQAGVAGIAAQHGVIAAGNPVPEAAAPFETVGDASAGPGASANGGGASAGLVAAAGAVPTRGGRGVVASGPVVEIAATGEFGAPGDRAPVPGSEASVQALASGSGLAWGSGSSTAPASVAVSAAAVPAGGVGEERNSSPSSAAAAAGAGAGPGAGSEGRADRGLAVNSERLGAVRIGLEGGMQDLRVSFAVGGGSGSGGAGLVSAEAPRLVADLAAQGVRVQSIEVSGEGLAGSAGDPRSRGGGPGGGVPGAAPDRQAAPDAYSGLPHTGFVARHADRYA